MSATERAEHLHWLAVRLRHLQADATSYLHQHTPAAVSARRKWHALRDHLKQLNA